MKFRMQRVSPGALWLLKSLAFLSAVWMANPIYQY